MIVTKVIAKGLAWIRLATFFCSVNFLVCTTNTTGATTTKVDSALTLLTTSRDPSTIYTEDSTSSGTTTEASTTPRLTTSSDKITTVPTTVTTTEVYGVSTNLNTSREPSTAYTEVSTDSETTAETSTTPRLISSTDTITTVPTTLTTTNVDSVSTILTTTRDPNTANTEVSTASETTRDASTTPRLTSSTDTITTVPTTVTTTEVDVVSTILTTTIHPSTAYTKVSTGLETTTDASTTPRRTTSTDTMTTVPTTVTTTNVDGASTILTTTIHPSTAYTELSTSTETTTDATTTTRYTTSTDTITTVPTTVTTTEVDAASTILTTTIDPSTAYTELSTSTETTTDATTTPRYTTSTDTITTVPTTVTTTEVDGTSTVFTTTRNPTTAYTEVSTGSETTRDASTTPRLTTPTDKMTTVPTTVATQTFRPVSTTSRDPSTIYTEATTESETTTDFDTTAIKSTTPPDSATTDSTREITSAIDTTILTTSRELSTTKAATTLEITEDQTTYVSSTTHATTLPDVLTTESTTARPEPTTIFIPCPAENFVYSGVELSFSETTPGKMVYSEQKCSNESTNSEQPLASRLCSETGWEDPELLPCYSSEDAAEEIERIANQTITEENVEEVASDLALVTTQTDDLDPTEIDSVADSLEAISNANSSSPEVTESVVGTVNNLMEVDESELEESGSSTSVVTSLEQQVSNVQENPYNFTDVQDNVGVRAVKLDPEITKSITFINVLPEKPSGSEIEYADLSEDNAQLYNEDSEKILDNSLSSIFVPTRILELALEADTNITQVPVSFFIYKDARLFQTSETSTSDDPDVAREGILSQVIAATLEVDIEVKDLPPESAVITRFQLQETLGEEERILNQKCVFWVPSQGSEGGNYWSEEGCNTTEERNQTVCTCDHLTSFAVLVGIGKALTPGAKVTLTVISWVGSCLSIAGLIMCCVALVAVRKVRRKQASKIHFNLFICLIGFYVTFLVGDLLKTKPEHCKNITASIQYFCLASVGWMTVEGVNMYYRFVRYERNEIPYFIPLSCCLVYGLNLVPVLTVYFISSFELEGYCFLPPGKALYYGFLMEVLILIVFNIIIFSVVVRRVIFRPMLSKKSSSAKSEAVSRLQLFIAFWFLLGISWVFGFLSVIPNRKTITFEVIFCIFTSLQGILLVVLIFTRDSDVQESVSGARKRLWKRMASSEKKSTTNTGDASHSFSELIKMNTSNLSKSA